MNYSLSGNGNNGTVSWSGNGVDNSGLFDPSIVNQGTTNLTLTYEEDGCTFMESIPVEVFDVPQADFTIDQVICVSETTSINYQGSASLSANFIWDFDNGNVISGTGSGPYQIDWNNPGTYQVDLFVEENGCNSPLVSKNIQIDAPLATPVLNCETSVSDILFTWDNIPNALDYQVNVLSGMSGTQTGNEYSISGLMVNETVTIELIVTGNTVCGPSKDTLTCQTQDCPDVQVEIEPVASICYDGNQNAIQLSATLSGNMHQGSFSWSGPGVDASGNFNPNDPALVPGGNNRLRVTYEEMGCSYNAVYDVNILEKPIAAYTTLNPICISDVSTFTYSGSNIPGLTYAWSFENGSPATASGQGPHQVSWNATGMPNIELQVINQSCPSDTLKEMIMVDPELDNPTVICDVTESEIDFNWMPVPNVNDYQVNVLQGITGNFNGFNHYIVGGLNPGDSITIEIISSGNTACGPVSDTIKCYSDNCPPPTAEFGFDIDKTTVSFDNLSVNGLTYFWDLGDGNTSTDENPVHMYPRNGQYPVTLISYNDCDTVETILIVEINGPIPNAEFSSDKRRFCAPQVVEFTDNSTEDPIAWEWTFPGGDPMTSTLQNPIVTYNTPGTYPVTLKVTNIYGENNIVQTNYIIAEENPEADFEFTTQGLLVAFANRSTGAFTYTWDFGDGNASFDENPNHTYANPGTYTVSLTIGNSCGSVTKTEEITVRTSSLTESKDFYFFRVFPNPNRGIFTLEISGKPQKELQVEIYNVLGQKVFSQIEDFNTGRLKKEYNHLNLIPGAYTLKVGHQNDWVNRKLIIE
ncbi:MAG: PKD domain-containing protein [Saprospiraceae bacterium]